MSDAQKQKEPERAPEEKERPWVFSDEEGENDDEDEASIVIDSSAWTRLCSDYLRPHWFRFLFVAIILAVLSGSQFVVSYFGVIMVDKVLVVKPKARKAAAAAPKETVNAASPRPAAAPLEARKRWLLYLFIAYMVVRVVMAVCHLFYYMLTISIGEKVVLKLRERLQEKLFDLQMAYFDERQPGKIYSRVLDDAGDIQQRIQTTFGTLVQNLFLLVFGICALYFVNWRLALIVTLILPLYAVNYHLFRNKLKYLYRRFRRRNSSMYGVIADQIKGIRIIRLYCQQKRELSHFLEHATRVLRLLMGYNIVHGTYSSLSTIISGLGVAALVGVGGLMVRGALGQPEPNFTTGEFLFFYGTSTWLFSPIVMLSNMRVIVDNMNVTLSRIYDVLDTPTKIKDEPDAMALKTIRGDVDFIGVSLKYEGKDDYALRDVNLRIRAGMSVALVGPSGSGKSSMAKLLARLYDPSEGTILIDGHNIKDIKLSRLRRLVSIVLQEPKLFAGTIADNIKYGRDHATPREVMNAAQLADLHDHIMSLPEKYESAIGEEGLTLSGGQRQRLALAQAIITNPAILILDDSMSALDTVTEARITESLKSILSSRTSFIITHRLVTAMNADLIVALDEGRIVEMGNHEQLTARKGFYYELFNQG